MAIIQLGSLLRTVFQVAKEVFEDILQPDDSVLLLVLNQTMDICVSILRFAKLFQLKVLLKSLRTYLLILHFLW